MISLWNVVRDLQKGAYEELFRILSDTQVPGTSQNLWIFPSNIG